MTNHQTQRINPAAAVLWASAFLIAAIAIVQVGKLPGNPAYAGMSSSTSNYTVITANAGRGDKAAPYEAVWVVDDASQTVFVYEMEQGTLNLRSVESLPAMFRNAGGR